VSLFDLVAAARYTRKVQKFKAARSFTVAADCEGPDYPDQTVSDLLAVAQQPQGVFRHEFPGAAPRVNQERPAVCGAPDEAVVILGEHREIGRVDSGFNAPSSEFTSRKPANAAVARSKPHRARVQPVFKYRSNKVRSQSVFGGVADKSVPVIYGCSFRRSNPQAAAGVLVNYVDFI